MNSFNEVFEREEVKLTVVEKGEMIMEIYRSYYQLSASLEGQDCHAKKPFPSFFAAERSC